MLFNQRWRNKNKEQVYLPTLNVVLSAVIGADKSAATADRKFKVAESIIDLAD